MITWAGRVASMGEMKNTETVLVGKTKGNRLFGRLRLDGIAYCGRWDSTATVLPWRQYIAVDGYSTATVLPGLQ
jgi:hypothetical protein